MRIIKRFLAAVRFLTIFPVLGTWGTEESDLRGSVAFFPAVGLGLGIAAAGAGVLLNAFLPAWPAAGLLVVLLALFSGGLHMDGLADTADGFLSSRPRERVLEIMRDSRTGAMGVLAVSSLILVKAASLASLPRGSCPAALLLVPLAGRCSQVMGMALLPYARQETGLGSIFYEGRSRSSGVWACLVWMAAGFLLFGARGAACCLAAQGAVLVFSAWCHRRIGGATGDTLGAATEITEALTGVLLSGFLTGPEV